MKKSILFATLLASPAVAHPAGDIGHLPHWSILSVMIGIGLVISVYNAVRG